MTSLGLKLEPERPAFESESRSMLSAVSGYPYLKLFLVSFILMVVNEIIDLTEQRKINIIGHQEGL